MLITSEVKVRVKLAPSSTTNELGLAVMVIVASTMYGKSEMF